MAPNSDERCEPGSGSATYLDTTRSHRGRTTTVVVVGAVAVAMVVAIVGALALMRMSSTGDDLPMLRVGAQQRAMGEMGADYTMWAPTSFALADGVDIVAGAAPAWRWTAPTDADVAGLAQRLGLTGTPEPVAADMGGGWQLDGLTVAATGDWSFGPTSVVYVCADADPAAGGGRGGDTAQCDPVATPAAGPTEAEALATAERVIGEQNAAGYEVVSADPSWVAIEVIYLVDGQPSGQLGFFGFGSDGLSGFGRLGSAELVGEYPTISATDAVQRLNQPTGLGVVANATMLVTGRAVGAPVDDAPGLPDAPVVEPGEPFVGIDEPFVEPGVPYVEPEEVVVDLIGVRSVLAPFYDADGGVWSLSGYDYVDADGQSWVVIAVADDHIDADGDQPVDSPDSGATEPGFPGGELPSAPDVIGRAESGATVVIERVGFTVRVVARDGETFMVTEDFRSDRVNVVVVAGVVTDAYMG